MPENPEIVKQTPNHYLRAVGIEPIEGYKERAINFIDPAPKPFITQISLVEYFERIKRLKADKWQIDFCHRLQSALEQRHLPEAERLVAIWALIHAEAQLGKSTILANCLPAWIFGHDPLHKFSLATFGVERSQDHSKAVIDIMNRPIHKAIFPNQDGWVKLNASKAKWKTNARLQLPEAQYSFNPTGLESGLTGSGFDTLVIDDPYAKEKDAFSHAVRKSLQSFYDADVTSRSTKFSCIFGMFHRYHEEDLAGYLLDKGDFDYWRYATVLESPADLVYIHEKTGQRFEDPLHRPIGEYISGRRPASYYEKKRLVTRIWNSMFQGKPTSTEGDFFKIDRIQTINAEQGEREWAQCHTKVRSWDHAATDGDGDFTAGALIGVQSDGTVIIKDVELVQYESGARVQFQEKIALRDGIDVPVCIPQEVGEAGKTLVFLLTERLKGFSVYPRHVQTSRQTETSGINPKQRRAFNFSVAVNEGKVKFIEGGWNKEVIRALRNFGFTTFDDPVDALGDGYNYLFEQFHKGLVIKTPPINRSWKEFAFGSQIPAHWTVYAAVKIASVENAPDSGVIVARAAQNSGLTDTLFIVDEYKAYQRPYEDLFTWLGDSLKKYIAPSDTKTGSKRPVILLHPDSTGHAPAIRHKLQRNVQIFQAGDAGIVEANWYAQNGKLINLGDLPNIKQEAATWGFNDKGEPTKIGQVWDCLRMITYYFRTVAAGYTYEEKVEMKTPDTLKMEAIEAIPTQDGRDLALTSRLIERKKIRKEMDTPVRSAASRLIGRR